MAADPCNVFHSQLLREGKPEERLQTRTGQLVCLLMLHFSLLLLSAV